MIILSNNFIIHPTVTVFAKFLGLSGSIPNN